MEKIAIVGTGQTAFAAERRADTYADLVYEAVSEALADAGLTMDDIDNIVTASNDFWDGRTISSMAVGDAAGAAYGEGKNVSTVESDGAIAAYCGMSRILSGAYRNTLVVGHAKNSEGDNKLITNAFFDPITERSFGLDAVSAGALQARAYFDRTQATEAACAEVVERNRRNGAKNPKAQLRSPISADEALSSPFVAPPLRASDVAPESDGAAAVILAGEDFAKRCKKPVWLTGVGLCAEGRLGDRDLSRAPGLRQAARAAYRMAGVASPEREIDAAEISTPFSFQELLFLEELGLKPFDKLNLSGGCLCANAPVAAGLARLADAATRVREGAKRALAHGAHGPCAQAHAVWILGMS